MHRSSSQEKIDTENGREKRVRKQKIYDNDYVLFNAPKESEKLLIKTEATTNEIESNLIVPNAPGSASSITNEVKYNVGDLVWAKVSGHPWWPCVVARDAIENSYVKAVGAARPKRMFYVEFFGPSVEHAWVAEGGLIEYKGIEAFKTYAQDQVDQAPTKSQKEKLAERFQLKVALTRRDHWEHAVKEADDELDRKSNNNSHANGTYDSDEENMTPPTKQATNTKRDSFAYKNEEMNKSNRPRARTQTDNLSVKNKRKRLSSLANSDDKDTNNISLTKIKKNDKNKLKQEGVDDNLEKHNELKPSTTLTTTVSKREIRKPKFFIEQEAKLQQENQTQNLTLLSQIATAAQNQSSNYLKLNSLLSEDDEKQNKSNKSISDPSNKLTRRQLELEKKYQQQQQQQQEAIKNTQKDNSKRKPKRSKSLASSGRKEEDDSMSEEDLKPVTSRKNNRNKSEKQENGSSNNEDDETEENASNEGMNDEDLLDEIDIEYEKLQPGGTIRKENICSMCEMPGFLIDCQGPCQQSFHLDCIGLTTEPRECFKCDECLSGLHTCFVCKKPSTNTNMAKKCSSSSCGRYYHDECTKNNDLFRKENKSFLCPLHTCMSCLSESRQMVHSHSTINNNNASPTRDTNGGTNENTQLQSKGNGNGNNTASLYASKGRFMKCVRCPTAYHVGDYCLAAGSIVLAGYNIICPNHFQPVRGQSQHNRVNVTWCFVCCKGGDLLGCDSCPAAYHHSCLDNPPAPPSIAQSWTCEDCQHGKRPLYGEIVWVKVGVYRWWPAQICHPRNLPKNIRERPHQVGEFSVRFFGTNDYFWITRGRCFSFAEDDECIRYRGAQKGLAVSFQKGVQHAKVVFQHVQKLKFDRFNKTSGRDALKCAKYNFQFIKTSKPVGNFIPHRVPLSELPRCDCDSKAQNPCGTDDCLNRMLKYECHPAMCPAGERCQNQRFVKRQYPRQEPVQTHGRGWGLRSLVEIKKGEFVNEYVGELIDEEECKRRLESAHENDICNFYFLTVEKDKIIDAGPKGNLSRFMNHSCEPNLETQKWMVNGDIRVGLFAINDIPANTELTFNYNLDCLSNEKAACLCGARNCSGFIGVRPKNSNVNLNTNDKSKDAKRRPGKKRKLNGTTSNLTDNEKNKSTRKQNSESNHEASAKEEMTS